jgi:hypothetical protein
MQAGRQDSDVEERGVYWAPHRKHGYPILYAVDSRGEVVKRYVVPSHVPQDALVEWLWNYLDVVDPPVKLKLVDPVEEPRLHAGGWGEARSYERRLSRAASRRRELYFPELIPRPSSSS